jgi:hypothetical protein
MQIAGRVMNAAAPDEPIPGARLEIWQTDGTGRYYPEANGDYIGFRDSDIDRCRLWNCPAHLGARCREDADYWHGSRS